MGYGQLTTHVLNTTTGRPASGLVIDVCYLARDDEEPVVLKQIRTNADGRTDEPALAGQAFVAGVYELRFHAGDYLRTVGADMTTPAFLDVIPIRFGIADAGRHYHVPLLLSPYGYSTYRGS